MATGYWTPEDAPRPSGYMRLFSRLRPREGWLVLTLTWVAVAALPFASIEGGLITGIVPAVWLVTLGLVAAWWLAHSRLKGVLAVPVLALAGALADLLWGVYVLSVWPLLPQAGRWLSWGLSCGTIRVMGRRCERACPGRHLLRRGGGCIVGLCPPDWLVGEWHHHRTGHPGQPGADRCRLPDRLGRRRLGRLVGGAPRTAFCRHPPGRRIVDRGRLRD